MSNLVFLKGYNNYFNRKILTESSLQAYYDVVEDYVKLDNINFNPNDYVTTNQIVNWDTEWNPDYVLVLDSDDNLVSRWFILEAVRTRNGQYDISLKRDTISDYRTDVINSPVFIEKATLNESNPLICNTEGMQFNQIKKSEILLKDKTNMPWIVGYTVQDNNRYPSSDNYTGSSRFRTLKTSSGLPQWISNIMDTTVSFATNYDEYLPLKCQFQIKSHAGVLGIYPYELITSEDIYSFSSSNDNISEVLAGTSSYSGWREACELNWSYSFWSVLFNTQKYIDESVAQLKSTFGYISDSFNRLSQTNRKNLMTSLRNELGIRSYDNYKELKSWDGIIYKDTTTNYLYRISVVDRANSSVSKDYMWNSNSSVLNYFNTALQYNSNPSHADGTYTYVGDTTSTDKAVKMWCNYKSVYVYRTRVYSGEISQGAETVTAEMQVHISPTREHLLKQPYDMFCIPAGDLVIKNGSNEWTTVGDVALLCGRTLAKASSGTSGPVYDVQLLPYCPIQDLYDNGKIDITSLTAEKDYQIIYDQNDGKYSVMFWCSLSDFSFNINEELQLNRPIVNGEYLHTLAEDTKISNECDLYRLCSPNYNGLYDFNLAKNGGYVDFFNVDCSYKPFNPYIHINPNYQGLYGIDFNDSRGLICNGDFSIAVITDLWAQYELQNKNYNQIFNTKIETLDATKNLAMANLNVNALNDVFNNNAASTASGFLKGGTAGAIMSGVNATVNTGVRYGLGKYNIEEGSRIARNQLVQNYNYTLGNIQALPNSLAKTSSFTINNKIWPFIEYYSCTDEEKNILLNKVKYDGMTVMSIGKIVDYMQPDLSYIKGQLIRCETLSDDNHVFNDLYDELAKGVYI